MSSEIGWIDFSPNHRNRIRQFLELMGTGGVIDELGVGVIRDAMSNLLFPGFSTLYTRAKYFFITPYLLMETEDTERKKISKITLFRDLEIAANKDIIKFYDKNPERDKESYFGKNKRDGNLKRQPSEVYWYGITHFGLVHADGTLDQFLSRKKSNMEELLSTDRGDDMTKETGEDHRKKFVDVSYDKDWRKTIEEQGLLLTHVEAETLLYRFRDKDSDSLLSLLVSYSDLWRLYKECSSIKGNLTNPFVSFVEAANGMVKNETLRKHLVMAHDLSLFLHGAHIAYNIQIWSKKKCSEKFISELRDYGREWKTSLHDKMLNYYGFDINTYMSGLNVKPHTRLFLQELQKQVFSHDTEWNSIEYKLCDVVEKQERKNKRSKSRFVKLEQNKVVDDMDKEQWLGLSLINYRYGSALTVIDDIYRGLGINL